MKEYVHFYVDMFNYDDHVNSYDKMHPAGTVAEFSFLELYASMMHFHPSLNLKGLVVRHPYNLGDDWKLVLRRFGSRLAHRSKTLHPTHVEDADHFYGVLGFQGKR